MKYALDSALEYLLLSRLMAETLPCPACFDAVLSRRASRYRVKLQSSEYTITAGVLASLFAAMVMLCVVSARGSEDGMGLIFQQVRQDCMTYEAQQRGGRNEKVRAPRKEL